MHGRRERRGSISGRKKMTDQEQQRALVSLNQAFTTGFLTLHATAGAGCGGSFRAVPT